MCMPTSPLIALGEKIRAARIQQRYSVKSAAAAAHIARDTWKKIEDGKSVQDTNRGAALDLLGLDWNGDPVNQNSGAPAPNLDTGEMLRLLIEENRRLGRENEELRRTQSETG